jgi:hypothetical protein
MRSTVYNNSVHKKMSDTNNNDASNPKNDQRNRPTSLTFAEKVEMWHNINAITKSDRQRLQSEIGAKRAELYNLKRQLELVDKKSCPDGNRQLLDIYSELADGKSVIVNEKFCDEMILDDSVIVCGLCFTTSITYIIGGDRWNDVLSVDVDSDWEDELLAAAHKACPWNCKTNADLVVFFDMDVETEGMRPYNIDIDPVGSNAYQCCDETMEAYVLCLEKYANAKPAVDSVTTLLQ